MQYYPCYFEEDMNLPEKIPFANRPKNLVFSGGGIKGIAYLGAIKAIEEKNLLSEIKGYAGASAGAITAALLAIGMTSEELNRYMIDFNYNMLLKKSNVNIEKIVENPKHLLDPIIAGIVAYDEVLHKGLCDGTYFMRWLTRLFNIKGFGVGTTFKQLYDATGNNLKIALCNVSYGKTVIANYEHTPDMPVINSVRASMAIPFVYWPFEWEGDIYVDGGTMYNYPIELFDRDWERDQTLGFLLSAKEQIFKPKRKDDENLCQHIGCVYEALMNVDYEYCFRMNNQIRTVFIDTKDVNVLEFNVSKEDKNKLIQEGYEATIRYFYGGDLPN